MCGCGSTVQSQFYAEKTNQTKTKVSDGVSYYSVNGIKCPDISEVLKLQTLIVNAINTGEYPDNLYPADVKNMIVPLNDIIKSTNTCGNLEILQEIAGKLGSRLFDSIEVG